MGSRQEDSVGAKTFRGADGDASAGGCDFGADGDWLSRKERAAELHVLEALGCGTVSSQNGGFEHPGGDYRSRHNWLVRKMAPAKKEVFRNGKSNPRRAWSALNLSFGGTNGLAR